MASARKPAKTGIPETPLQALFMRRVREELDARNLTINGLAKYGVKQRTLDWSLKGLSVPNLTTVYQVAKALGIEAWTLFVERPQHQAPANIAQFPTTPAIIGQGDRSHRNKDADRKKTGR